LVQVSATALMLLLRVSINLPYFLFLTMDDEIVVSIVVIIFKTFPWTISCGRAGYMHHFPLSLLLRNHIA
jgi:hypothetical protein